MWLRGQGHVDTELRYLSGTACRANEQHRGARPSDGHRGSRICFRKGYLLLCVIKWSLDEYMENRCNGGQSLMRTSGGGVYIKRGPLYLV